MRAHAYYAVPAPMRLLLHGLIADVLLARAAEGDDSLGLGVAWHCMRCGRKEESAKHLLLGARASIRRGAVHEAERRLDSGLESLSGDVLKEARLLLVELLQEQGRWSESLALFLSFPDERNTVSGRCLAGHALLSTDQATKAEEQSYTLLARRCITDSMLDPQTRLRALRLATILVLATDRPCSQGSSLRMPQLQIILVGRRTSSLNGTLRSRT